MGAGRGILKSKFAFESFIKTFLNIPVSPTSGSKAAAALKIQLCWIWG